MSKIIEVAPLSRKAICDKAGKFLQHYYPDIYSGKDESPVPIEDIFSVYMENDYKFSTGYRDLSLYNAEGITDAARKESYVDISLGKDSNNDAQRRRYNSTASHETGHIVLHAHQFDDFLSCNKDDRFILKREAEAIVAYKNPEWQAWAFAEELLMPTHLVQQMMIEYNNEYMLLDAMVKRFDVNMAFAKSRLAKIK